ncbi:MAG: hypothetical protein PVH62_00875 [Anaerolineae bacterium]|jgi:hypothetical protein
MRRFGWQTLLGAALVVLSVIFYLLHYLIFRDPHHIFTFLVGDVAFVFIEVLMVTLIIHRLLGEREKQARLEKLNMVIGTFFSEVGTRLLGGLSQLDPKLDRLRGELVVGEGWSERQFSKRGQWLRDYDYEVEPERADLKGLKHLLVARRDFLLRLLENPNLLEHESFTELLRAVFHLMEELDARRSLEELPTTDYAHLAGDMERVYVLLVREWLEYMQYLKSSYPYLFSLALRTNPFDADASPVVG